MNVAVVVFPGSNCDHEAQYMVEAVLGQQATMVWHKETSLAGVDVVILAVPDTLIGKLAAQISPQLKPGTMVITLDAAAPFAGHLPDRAHAEQHAVAVPDLLVDLQHRQIDGGACQPGGGR